MRRKEVYDERRASRAVAVTTAKRVGRAGALWGLLFGLTIAATAATYSKTFPTAASRATLAHFQGNAGFEALFGPIRAMDTVAGYTAYKTMAFMVILAAIWGLLVATRVMRGEEDAGRWELFLSGRTTRASAAGQAAIGLGVGLAAMWIPTALLAAGVGADPKVGFGLGTALFFATAVAAAAAVFMAIGMFVGQLAASRHDANLIGAGVLAAFFLVKMVADSAADLNWLRWVTPFGWIEELRPLTGSKPLAFVPIFGLVLVLVVLAVRVASRRDLGVGAFAIGDTPKPRTFLLGGQAGLTVRLTRPVVIAWLAALAAMGLAFGLVTQSVGRSLQTIPTLDNVITRLGATRAGAVAYLGFVFLIAAGLVAIAVAGQIAAVRNEEAAGHLENLLTRPVARWRWLSVRLAVGVGLVVLASALTGIAAWVGAASQHAGIGIGELLEAGLNVAPPALFILGVSALVFGLWPRGAIGVAYGLVVWSFAVEVFAGVVNSNHWLLDTSPLVHITPAPAAAPNWTAAAWLVGLGAIAAIAGITAFSRRDLVGA